MGVQMMPGRIKLQIYLKIRKGTKNVRNPHILRILLILHFFDVLKVFWDFIWLWYCLNRFITFSGCSNDVRIYHTPKILKKLERVWRMWRILTFFVLFPFFTFFDFFKKNWDFLWLWYCLSMFITCNGCSNDAWKYQTPKILKN